MIQAGVIVEGLDKENDQKPKRVVYSNKRKKPTKQEQVKVDDQNLTTKAEAEAEVVSQTIAITEKDVNENG